MDYIYPYHNLTDLFVCSAQCNISEGKYSDFLFEVCAANDILHRFGRSHEFWEGLSARDVSLKIKLDYYEIEHIDDPCQVTVAVKPKEYLEQFESENVNKKHRRRERKVSSLKTMLKE